MVGLLVLIGILIIAGIIFIIWMLASNRQKNKKMQLIQKVIQKSRYVQVIDQKMKNVYQPHGTEFKPNNMYIYMDFFNVLPRQAYVFPASRRLTVGRTRDKVHICIQQETVDALQGEIYVQDSTVFFRNVGQTRQPVIKRGFRKSIIGRGEMLPIYPRDKLYIGTIGIQFLLFWGEGQIIYH